MEWPWKSFASVCWPLPGKAPRGVLELKGELAYVPKLAGLSRVSKQRLALSDGGGDTAVYPKATSHHLFVTGLVPDQGEDSEECPHSAWINGKGGSLKPGLAPQVGEKLNKPVTGERLGGGLFLDKQEANEEDEEAALPLATPGTCFRHSFVRMWQFQECDEASPGELTPACWCFWASRSQRPNGQRPHRCRPASVRLPTTSSCVDALQGRQEDRAAGASRLVNETTVLVFM